MRFRVSSDIFDRFPQARIGILAARSVDNRGEEPALTELLRDAQKTLLEKLGSSALIEHPRIACWRDAYRSFGAKPKKYPSSIENLARRCLKGEPPRSVNTLVDLYNVTSLRHFLPAGGEDLDAIRGDIELVIAGEEELPIRLLGEAEERPPRPGEVIYRDAAGAICRRWNWKEAERTKLTRETRNAVLVLEALPPIEPDALEAALADLAMLVERWCGGALTRYVLHVAESEAELS